MLVASEDEDSIRNVVQMFKTNNPKWTDIKVVIIDKDMTEGQVFKSEIPDAKLQICLFHVLRNFSREFDIAFNS